MLLKESASSPSWSFASTAIRCEKSPCRTRSVPTNSSCTDPVIERASARPISSATNWMIRNRTPTSTMMATSSWPKVRPRFPTRGDSRA